MKSQLLILGIGNCLLRDDGVGVHAVRLLNANPPAEVDILEAGTDLLGAIPWIEMCTIVLAIDAMEAGGTAGSLYECRGEDLAVDDSRHSLHGFGLKSVLDLLEPEHRPQVWLLGVQPACIDYGLDLSPPVAAALPKILGYAHAFAAAFKRAPTFPFCPLHSRATPSTFLPGYDFSHQLTNG